MYTSSGIGTARFGAMYVCPAANVALDLRRRESAAQWAFGAAAYLRALPELAAFAERLHEPPRSSSKAPPSPNKASFGTRSLG